MSPRKRVPIPASRPSSSDNLTVRPFTVHLTRVVEQACTTIFNARSTEEAEEMARNCIEDRAAVWLDGLQWRDVELEVSESVVHVEEGDKASDLNASPIPVKDDDDESDDELEDE